MPIQKDNRKRNFILGFATIIFLLGLSVTLYLVQRSQDIRRDAASGAACTQSGDCVLLNAPGNSGTYSAPRNILYVDITNQDVIRFNPGTTNDGCYDVAIQGNALSWNKVGSGSSCKDISNIQIWMGDGISSPTPTTQATLTPTIPQQIVTPTTNVTVTPTIPGSQQTPTTQPSITGGQTSTPTPQSTATQTPTPSEPPRGGVETPTPTNTVTPTSVNNPTGTPTSLIAMTSPTPGGDTLPQAGVGSVTVLLVMLGTMIIMGAGILFVL
jgi:hypothetical protein